MPLIFGITGRWGIVSWLGRAFTDSFFCCALDFRAVESPVPCDAVLGLIEGALLTSARDQSNSQGCRESLSGVGRMGQ